MYNANSGLFAACSVRSCFYRLYKSCHVLDWSPLCEYYLAAIDPTRGWLLYLACLFTCFIYCCCVSVDVVLYFTCNTTLLIMIPYPIKEGKRICGSIVFLQLKVCCDVILTPFLSTLLNAKEIIIQLWTHLFIWRDIQFLYGLIPLRWYGIPSYCDVLPIKIIKSSTCLIL